VALPQVRLYKAFSLSVLLDKFHAHFLNVKRKHGEITTSLSKEKAESLKYHNLGHRPVLNRFAKSDSRLQACNRQNWIVEA
jgi:hypothetical protein